jgi:hypothetical protein
VTAWHLAQLAVSMLALAQLGRVARAVLWIAPCDARMLVEAIAVSLAGRQRDLARRLASSAEPAWAAQMTTLGLADPEADTPRNAMDDLRAALVGFEAERVRALAALGRIAGPLAFLAIVIELAAAFGPGHGLLALQRGLVQSLAIERAALSFAVGLATTLVCTLGARLLGERLRALSEELKQAREALLRALEPTADM